MSEIGGHVLRTRDYQPAYPDHLSEPADDSTDCGPIALPPHPLADNTENEEDGILPAQYIDGKIYLQATPGKAITRNDRRSREIWSRLLICSVMPWLCSITRTLSVCGMVQACHFVPRNWSYTKKKLMLCVEFCLGFMRPRSLNLDTRFNIWALSVTYHYAFDHGAFGLLPTLLCILLVRTLIRKNLGRSLKDRDYFKDYLTPPKDSNGQWLYDFLCFSIPASHSIPVNTPYQRSDGPWMNDAEEWRFEDHPYRGLNQLECHVHPFFVIMNTHAKIQEYGMQPFWTADETKRASLIVGMMDLVQSAPVKEFAKLPSAPHRPLVRSPRSVTPPLTERSQGSQRSTPVAVLFQPSEPNDDEPVAGPSSVRLEDMPPKRARRLVAGATKRQREPEAPSRAPVKKRKTTQLPKDTDVQPTAVSSGTRARKAESSRPKTRSVTRGA